GPGHQQRERQDHGGRGPGGPQQPERRQDGSADGDRRGAEAPDQGTGSQTGQDRPGREGGQDQPVGRVRQPQLGLDLGVAGQQVRQQRPVGQEQSGDGTARMAQLRGQDSHTYQRTQAP